MGGEGPDQVEPCRVPLVEAERAHCRWPLWEHADPHRDVCGAPTAGTGPYCAAHRKVAYAGRASVPRSIQTALRDGQRLADKETVAS